jgi:hypothetical protein
VKNDELHIIARLILGQRTAALGTLRDGAPFVSMVAYAPEPHFEGFLLHLSTLSPHTQHLAANPRASLLIVERDDDRDDPQTLARVTLIGEVALLEKASPEYTVAQQRYLARLPASAMLFDFPDFSLYRLMLREARYIGGFARAYTLTPERLRAAYLATQGTE